MTSTLPDAATAGGAHFPSDAVGRFYRDFHQLTDGEVVALLTHPTARRPAPAITAAAPR